MSIRCFAISVWNRSETVFRPIIWRTVSNTKKTSLKAALLDQRIVAGLGNIYVCEALWRTGLSPERDAGSLVRANGGPKKKLDLLERSIRSVLQEAIEAGGSSLRDHQKTDGTLGYFQHTFAVYDQEGAALSDHSLQRRHKQGCAKRQIDLLLPGLPALSKTRRQ